jgi:hypothetical protein
LDFFGFSGVVADLHLDARGTQFCKALPRDQRVGVLQRSHHPVDASGDQGIAAGACAALMGARLKRHISGSALGVVPVFSGVLQRPDFSVRATRRLGLALANHLALRVHQHGTHSGVGGAVTAIKRSLSQGNGQSHGAVD